MGTLLVKAKAKWRGKDTTTATFHIETEETNSRATDHDDEAAKMLAEGEDRHR